MFSKDVKFDDNFDILIEVLLIKKNYLYQSIRERERQRETEKEIHTRRDRGTETQGDS